jgi:hypothetical protein
MNKPNYAASHVPPSPHFPSKIYLPEYGSVYLRNEMGTEGSTVKSRITPLVGMKNPERRNPSPPPPSTSKRLWYSIWLNWMQIPWGDWSF